MFINSGIYLPTRPLRTDFQPSFLLSNSTQLILDNNIFFGKWGLNAEDESPIDHSQGDETSAAFEASESKRNYPEFEEGVNLMVFRICMLRMLSPPISAIDSTSSPL